MALGRARRPRGCVGDFKARRDQNMGLTVWYDEVYGYFLTGFRTELVALCIWQRTLLNLGRRNAAREADGGL